MLRFDFLILVPRPVYIICAVQRIARPGPRWSGRRRHFTRSVLLRITSPAGPDIWASSESCKHPGPGFQVLLMWFIRVHSTWVQASDSALRSIRALSPDHRVASQSGPTDVGSDGLNRSLFRGISGARTRAAGPVGPRKGPPASVGWTPRDRSSRCTAALRSGVEKRNVGTPGQ